MTTKHTPTPWEANEWATGFSISAPDEHYTVANLSDCNNAEANAAFILTACNSHAALVEALNDIIGAFAKARTMRAPAGHYDEDIYYNGIDLHAQIENAREALRTAQGTNPKIEDTPTPVIVFVGGGCVSAVLDTNGKDHPCYSVVDYDNADNGQCPVCGMDELDNTVPCGECGYFENDNNAFECAVKLLQEKE